MKPNAIGTQPVKKEATALRIVPFNQVFQRMNEVHHAISGLAFELFERRGGKFGHDFEDWLKAEAELLHPVHITLSDTENALLVRVEVPGFRANEIEVSLDPRRLTITGKRETKEEHKTAKTIYSEHCANQILRIINLPAEVDTTKVTATLKDGVLELDMPKAALAKKVLAKTKAV